ncbi:CPBP family intramembrane glutamic endopeptidase [Staphylococcus simulans]|uniref:CPBP family intramembrane glutamic endopeptidase n=1 Tax=Staphylococcus simulans TaxID=1286 RepID=UPI000D042F0D|nr:CPBP family intramembrane glutamic endopeptidase [Staphylococcus simulans]PTJ16166.1 CPBP family intramembrane metalloprotease [Staphylococcus simulans]PTJ48473.1 CPBP family intramembrane metalloprotease [Staphylococcus simulans]PTJ86405.1 CPBP family intramembrane metalloprotease [Staphylococcus simulans]
MSKQNDDYIYYTDESTNPEHYITPNETHEPNRKKSKRSHPDKIRPKGRRWLNIILWIVFMFLCTTPTLVAMFLIGFVAMNPHGNPLAFAGIIVGYVIWSALVIWLLVWYYRKKGYESLKPLGFVDIAWNILYFIATRIWTALCVVVMAVVFGEQGSENDDLLLKQVQHLQDFTNPMIVIALILFVFHLTFVGPFLEEITFRGIFKETIFSRFSFWLPMLISSAIFSINHASTNIVGFLLYMGMGACFYLAYQRRRNLWDSYMVHALNNGTASIAIIIGLLLM